MEKSSLSPQTLKKLLLLGLLGYFLLLPFAISGDGAVRFLFIYQTLKNGFVPGMVYPIWGPAFSLPLLLPGLLFGSETLTVKLALFFNLTVFTLGLFFLARLLKPILKPITLYTFLLILAFGSFLPRYLSDFYGEVFTAVFVAVGIVHLVVKNNRFSWALILIGVLNQPATFLGLALMTAYVAFWQKKPAAFVILPVALILIVAEAWLRLGQNPLAIGFGYTQATSIKNIMPYSGTKGFSYPLVYGLLANLISFGKGLLFFAPGLLLALPASGVNAKVRRIYTLMLLYLFGSLLVYSKWSAWAGGFSWGPRFLSFGVFPASLTLAINFGYTKTGLKRQLLVLGVLALSFWAAVAGHITFLDPVCETNRYQYDFLCWFTPEFSPLFQPLTRLPPMSVEQMALVGISGIVFMYLIKARVFAVIRLMSKIFRQKA